jgi:hypothetical protein
VASVTRWAESSLGGVRPPFSVPRLPPSACHPPLADPSCITGQVATKEDERCAARAILIIAGVAHTPAPPSLHKARSNDGSGRRGWGTIRPCAALVLLVLISSVFKQPRALLVYGLAGLGKWRSRAMVCGRGGRGRQGVGRVGVARRRAAELRGEGNGARNKEGPRREIYII